MPDPSAPAPEAYWRQQLTANDRAAHAAEAARATAHELAGLRIRCAELDAALTQARAAIAVRHELLAEQSLVIAERDRQLDDARAELAAAQAREATLQHTLDQVLGSRRWRYGGAAAALVGAPRRLIRRGRA